MTTRTFQFTVASASSAPSWFTALGHKQWASPVTNTIQSVLDPLATTTNVGAAAGPSGIISAYTGAVCDQSLKTVALLGNGGHDDYWGNEVYSVNLGASSPAWTRRRNATANPKSGAPSLTYPQLADGRPCSDHTGDYCVAANGKWFKCGLGSSNFNGDVKENYWWSFDPVSNDYTFLGSSYPTGVAGAISSGTAYDPTRNQIIKALAGHGTSSLRVYSLDGVQVASGASNYNEGSVTAAFDYTNDVILVLSTNPRTQCHAFKRSTMAMTTITHTGAPPSDATAKVWWHAPSNAFITWDGAQGLKKLTPTVVNGAYTALAWSSVAGNGGAAPPSSGLLGSLMYSKISLINDMGNGNAALVIVPRWSAVSDVWVMRLTGAV
jgi:hypothetical protein